MTRRRCCCADELICCGNDPASIWYLGSDPTTTTIDVDISGLPNIACGACAPSDCLNGGVTLSHLSTTGPLVTYQHTCGGAVPADGGLMRLNIVIHDQTANTCEDLDFGSFVSCTDSGGYCAQLLINPNAGASRYVATYQGEHSTTAFNFDLCTVGNPCTGGPCGAGWTPTINSVTINIAP